MQRSRFTRATTVDLAVAPDIRLVFVRNSKIAVFYAQDWAYIFHRNGMIADGFWTENDF